MTQGHTEGGTAFSEWFWSEASAKRAGARLEKRHPGVYRTNVRYARRADGSHDWLLQVSAAPRAVVRITSDVAGRDCLKAVRVAGKREARRVADDHGAQPWNF